MTGAGDQCGESNGGKGIPAWQTNRVGRYLGDGSE